MPRLSPREVARVFIPKPLEDHFLKLNYLYRNGLQKQGLSRDLEAGCLKVFGVQNVTGDYNIRIFQP